MELSRRVVLCRYHFSRLSRGRGGDLLVKRPSLRYLGSQTQGASSRSGTRWWLLGSLLAVPSLGAATYYYSERHERRRMRILLQGIGRFWRSLLIGSRISVDYWWTSRVTLRGEDEVSEFGVTGYVADVLPCL
ncbi:uncharacterized aarF domain-containing protein kinase 5-like [Spea bombifrons]|uniref:uncharacterized aarF domain-containing protein kinase 5-like n=1 Tax=Spea bombifrons TaxID=233779 RepID=UPI00234A3249|nr:uncharacterized aarF domain-containing protein kinase 5-like [Spea bombifrons]